MRSLNNNIGENSPEFNAGSSNVGNNISSEIRNANELTSHNIGGLQTGPKDDERDLIELMIASSTIPPSNTKIKNEKSSANTSGMTKGDAKKRVKLQRDVARDLSLLLPDSEVIDEEKAFGFAQAYYLKVKDRVDEKSFSQFISILNNYNTKTVKAVDLYHDIIPILKQYPDLSEEFLAFLLPHQAMELGVYMEYFCISKIKHFLRKLEVYFGKQPQQVRKVYECLTKLVEQSTTKSIDQATIRSAVLPLLKGSSLLTEYFLQLFPCEQPPIIECTDSKDFEKVDCGEFDDCGTGIQHIDGDSWDWETVEIPDIEEPFGSDNCPCVCHNNVSSSVSLHCFSCGIKFINGRVFVQSGKVLRPAQLVVEGANKKEVIDRIAKKTTEVKDYDEKGGGTVRHRKRPATDNSPNKGGCGTCNTVSSTAASGSCNLLSPNEIDDDASDPKPPSAKVKSPRAVKTIKIIKTNGNRYDLSTKDKNLSEKDKDSTAQPTEDDGLILDSFVLLDDLKNANNLNEKTSENNDIKENSEKLNKREDYDEDDDDYMKSKTNVLAPSSSSSQGSTDINTRDDEDDDVEYIDIDDDEDGDEVDDDCDDIEEDDPHNDDDGEEEEEEEYDDDDIEEVDIDEEFDKEMDVEDVQDGNYASDKVNKNSNSDVKSTAKDIVKSSDSLETKAIQMKIKEEPNDNQGENFTPILIDNIKMEIVDDEYKNENHSVNSVMPSPSGELYNEDNLDCRVDNGLSSMNSSNVSENITGTSVTTVSTPISWTKEEDKVILQTFQQENDTDQTFMTIRERLPQRSVEEIKSRFHILMLLLKRMTTNKNIE